MRTRPRNALVAFWRRAYEENVTGMAAMVAFNLMLAVFPFALLVLFVFGRVLQSPEFEATVLRDLEELFPSTERDTLASALERVRDRSTEIGIIAIVAGIWIGASFWGAMDTAFCRIYHVDCRGWIEQKRFALIMLAVVVVFLLASVAIPVIEGLLLAGIDDLPLGLSDTDRLASAVLVGGGLLISFLILCLIYWAVPKGHMPWRGVWPGALLVTLIAGIANLLFPVFLVNISTIDELGRIVSFVLVALVWFYVLALLLLAGAVVNALRYELHDTGTLRGMTEEFSELPAPAMIEGPAVPGSPELPPVPPANESPAPGSPDEPAAHPAPEDTAETELIEKAEEPERPEHLEERQEPEAIGETEVEATEEPPSQ